MTTESPSVAEEMVTLIKARPHWRVVVEPQVFATRFPSPRAALDAVLESRVHLRGWDFPHLGEPPRGGNLQCGNGWTSWSKFKDTEAWLVTASGQFVHYLTLREERPGLVLPDGPVLVYEATVYQVTEIFEFASRLASRADYSPGVRISVQISGTGKRALGRQRPDGSLEPFGPFSSYVCDQASILTETVASLVELRYGASELSRRACMEVLDRFGFRPPSQVIQDLQEALLERRRAG